MTKIAFIYKGRKGTFIASKILHKPKKEFDKKDIIELDVVSKYDNFKKYMTREESIIIANALLMAFVLSEKN